MNFRFYSGYLLIPLAVLPFGYLLWNFRSFFLYYEGHALLTIVVLFSLMLAFLFLWRRSQAGLEREEKKRKKITENFSLREEEYISLIQNAGGVLYRCDHRGNFTYLSRKCLELTGYEDSVLRGKHFTSLILEEWKGDVLDFYRDQNNHRIPETVYRFPILSKDGYKKWVEQTVVLLHDGEHRLGYQGIVKDVTDKKLGEDLLREANRELLAEKEEANFRMQAILDHIPMIVYLKDLDGRFVMVNKKFHEAFGSRDRDVVGKRAGEGNKYGKGSLDHRDTDEEIVKTAGLIESEDLVLTIWGNRHMQVTKFPLFDGGKKLFGIGGVDMDVTDKVQTRVELERAKLQAEKAEKAQEQFLASMSHEIRTPLNGIVTMTELLLQSPLNEKQKQWGTLVRQSSDILLSLINDLLDLSKIKAGMMTLEKMDFSFQKIIDHITGSFCLRAEQKGLKFYVRVDKNLPLFIRGDEHKLYQILNNLLSNALKFTQAGEISLEVNLSGANSLEFTVRDTGIGIPEKYKASIFESYTQAGEDTTRRFGGTGLGLAITKKLIELQSGSIDFTSEEGKGTSFRFYLPFQAGHVSTENAPAVIENFVSLQCRKILVVDDNVINQKAIEHMLTKEGIQISIAGNGDEAVRLLNEGFEPECILMDLQMPGMNGFETTEYIRHELKLDTPIIAMTASTIRNERQKCFAAGMNDYLTKPFTVTAITTLLQKYFTTSLRKAI